jgi:hypothetical protein
MKRYQGCPLTFRFGKDIANLIYNAAWQLQVNDVNRQFLDQFIFQDFYKSLRVVNNLFFSTIAVTTVVVATFIIQKTIL